ncbi:hypothetical protein RIR_jg1516.t1 [Rhizophagus irregularis DAOM 181602=DAOM 197198]|nr:hypothetical protein RIR_jg1516.t1 [Rhizophagus irregularis DAOM 181602=DAOM 197198]
MGILINEKFRVFQVLSWHIFVPLVLNFFFVSMSLNFGSCLVHLLTRINHIWPHFIILDLIISFILIICFGFGDFALQFHFYLTIGFFLLFLYDSMV